MAGPKAVEVPSAVDLPSVQVLDAAPLVVETERATLWDMYWRHGATTLNKEADIAVIPFASASWNPYTARAHELTIATTALKVLLVFQLPVRPC